MLRHVRAVSVVAALVTVLSGCSGTVEGAGRYDAGSAPPDRTSQPLTPSPSGPGAAYRPGPDDGLPADGVRIDGRCLPDSPRGLPLDPKGTGLRSLDQLVEQYPANQRPAVRAALQSAGLSQAGQRTWASGTAAGADREADVLTVLVFADSEGTCRFVRGQIASGASQPLAAPDLPGAVGAVSPPSGGVRSGYAMLTRERPALSAAVLSSREPVEQLRLDLLRAAYRRI